MEIPEKHYQLVSTGINNKLKPTDTNWYDNDHLVKQLSDLINPEFRAWYCREFYRLGKSRVLELASQARADGHNPKKLFSYLLRKS